MNQRLGPHGAVHGALGEAARAVAPWLSALALACYHWVCAGF